MILIIVNIVLCLFPLVIDSKHIHSHDHNNRQHRQIHIDLQHANDGTDKLTPIPINLSNIQVRNVPPVNMKSRLLDVLHQYKKDVEEKMVPIFEMHKYNENNNMYQLGYLISFVIKEYEVLLETFDTLCKNINTWSPRRLRQVYEKLLKRKSEVYDLWQLVDGRYGKTKNKENELANNGKDKIINPESKISWSYYDDNFNN